MKSLIQKTLAVVIAALIGLPCLAAQPVFADVSAGSAVVIKGEKTDGSIEVSDDDEFVETTEFSAGDFKNEYRSDDASIQITGKKTLKNGTLSGNDFSFVLLDENGKEVETVKNDAKGTISFKALSFSKAGTYKYSVKEVPGSDASITYDTSEKPVTITVTEKDGKLSAKASGTISFTNEKKKEEKTATTTTVQETASPVQVTITATKVYQGGSLKGDDFRFELLDKDGKVLQTKSNDSKGIVTFDPITYSSAGDYAYNIREVAGNEKGVTYDSSLHTVGVSVKDKGGQLTAEIMQNNPTFTNTRQDVTENSAHTGDAARTIEFVGIFGMAVSGIALCIYCIYKEHKSH